jgi:hypothetical protein
MGEVYRARDPRLGRDVALKIVASHAEGQVDRFGRFEQEARAVAALNHPHVLAVHDVGSENGVAYVVFELLEGQTLRERLAQGPIPPRKAVEYGVQISRGLAAAHARGIVHRDLKPQNLFLTSDGQIKILDFGLAKLTESSDPDVDAAATRTATGDGLVVGTAGYMAPEQARGQKADARSDVFALGAILYEMLTGQPAFGGDTIADRLSAILHHDPPELASAERDAVSPGLERVVRRCLEKDREERFQAARDVAFALEAIGGSREGMEVAEAPPRLLRRPLRTVALVTAGATVLVGGAFAAGIFLGSSRSSPRIPVFKQLTFRRGMVRDARFTADGNTVAYSAIFDGNAAETYSMRLDRPEALPLGLPPSRLVGLSSTGEMALILGKQGERRAEWVGTLARMPLSGGAPREVLDQVYWADWSPDGQDLAVVRAVSGQLQLEYPIGTTLQRPLADLKYSSFEMRVSPRGDRVAYTSDKGVVIVDRAGDVRTLETSQLNGLAWDPAGDAVWVSDIFGQSCELWRLGLTGGRRLAARLSGAVALLDASRDGRLLVHTGFERQGIRGRARGEAAERDLGVFTYSLVAGLSADGSHVLAWDSTEPGVALSGAVYLRSLLGGPPIRVADGWPLAFSPDGKWVLMNPPEGGRDRLVLVPTGPGTPNTLDTGALVSFGSSFVAFPGGGSFLDSTHFLIDATVPGRRPRTFLLDLTAGKPVPVTPEGALAVHGTQAEGEVLGIEEDRAMAWYPLRGGEPRRVKARLPAGVMAVGATADRRNVLFVFEDNVPGRLDRLDLTTGRRTPWKVLMPEDPAGVVGIQPPMVTPDLSAYAYSYTRYLQDLYLVDGLR